MEGFSKLSLPNKYERVGVLYKTSKMQRNSHWLQGMDWITHPQPHPCTQMPPTSPYTWNQTNSTEAHIWRKVFRHSACLVVPVLVGNIWLCPLGCLGDEGNRLLCICDMWAVVCHSCACCMGNYWVVADFTVVRFTWKLFPSWDS